MEEGLRLCRDYERHLEGIAARLPDETREFALAAWYRNPGHHDCPHDAWLLDLDVKARAGRHDKLDVELTLLGAYHDRILRFRYSGVSELKLEVSGAGASKVGDWVWDEFDIAGQGGVSHEIQWMFGPPWRIVAEQVGLSVEDYVATNPQSGWPED